MAGFQDDLMMDVEEIDAEEEEITHKPVHFLLAVLIPTLSLIASIVGFLSMRISKLFFKPTEKERELMKTAIGLKNDMKAISMVDEFAKYAKTQRRLNQINLDLEATVGSRQALQTKLRTIITIAIYAIVGLMSAFIMYNFRSTPVFIIPPNWFYPLSWILSYPTDVPGAISVVSFAFFVRVVSAVILRHSAIKQD